MRDSDASIRSAPLYMTCPSKMALGSLIRRITDIIVTLLPDPDSPTIPSTSPGETENETPSTAPTLPASVRKVTCKSRTSSSGSVTSS